MEIHSTYKWYFYCRLANNKEMNRLLWVADQGCIRNYWNNKDDIPRSCLLTRTWYQGPIAESNPNFDGKTWRNQVATGQEVLSLLSSFHSTWKCFAVYLWGQERHQQCEPCELQQWLEWQDMDYSYDYCEGSRIISVWI